MNKPPAPFDDTIEDRPFDSLLAERYLAYALSTITQRALPDVRDGLKPVHRRLLYAMRLLRLDPQSGFKKCARVVGDVIGKYHPHGEQAVYDALVRLAQDFAVRYPLVDGQGNFGNVDGDNPAAMRYTEARLTAVAEALLEGIDEDTVDFRATYDGEEEEPEVLPAAFPNLLANGATGIAVGMATSIPPHNADELCAALLHLIAHPDAGDDALLRLIPGPDFPTGGVIVEPAAAIREAYATGRGGFRLRARWEKEDAGRGAWCIVITEVPYQVPKARLVERLAELIETRKVPALGDVRDESTDDVRLVLEPRSRAVEPEMLMEQLFRLTDLETRIPLNLTVLDARRVPRTMSLAQALRAFIDHRKVVLVRRSQFRLGKIEARLEILDGLLKAYLNLDEVIRIIREADQPKPELMRAFDLTDAQAEAILNMRLRSLRKLEEIEITKEHKALEAERKGLGQLLRSEPKQMERIGAEIADIRKAFGKDTPLGRRRSDFAEAPATADIAPEQMIAREPITVVCSEKGWIRALKGHIDPNTDVKYKEGDRARFLLHAQTTDRLLLFATSGRFYTLGCDKLPGGRGQGEAVRLLIDLPNDHDIVALRVFEPGKRLLVAASDGRGFLVPTDEVLAQTRAGKQVLNPGPGAEAQVCAPGEGDLVAVAGNNRKLLVFPAADLPEMARGRGNILQKYKDGGLGDAKVFALEEGLTWRDGAGRVQTVADFSDWLGARGQAGRVAPRGFPKSNRFG
jgi:topoisomerase-4 subunit A